MLRVGSIGKIGFFKLNLFIFINQSIKKFNEKNKGAEINPPLIHPV